MANTIILNEKQLIALKKSMLNEFMVDPKSQVGRDGFSYFILMRGDLLFFNWNNVEDLDAFLERHKNELGIYVRRYHNRKDVFGSDDFDDLVRYLGHYVPYLITGTVLRGNEVHINYNEVYDIMSSNELYQLVKKMPNTDFFVDGDKVDKDAVLGDKGIAMPKVWYHGTTYGDALSILRKGLRPRPDKSVYKVKHDKTVFLTSDIKQAVSFSRMSSDNKTFKREHYPCVLEIDASKLDETKLVYDYDIHYSHTNRSDKVYNQRMVDLDLSYEKETNTIQGDKDPRKFKKVGYRGIILPDAITGVYIGSEKMGVDDFIDYAAKYIYFLDEGKELTEAAPEIDEYTIGDEGSNPPVGGNFCHVDENLEYEIDSSEIDLSSFKRKDELIPKIWDNGVLTSRVRLKLLDIADDFWKFVDLPWVKPKGIILTGSICNYNWSKFSDIDLHLIADFNEIDDKTDFVKSYLDAKKNEWNNEHSDLTIFDHQVELYVQNVGEMPKSGGIYDLEENEWVSKPTKDSVETIKLNKYEIKEKAAEIMTIIDGMYKKLSSTDDSYEIGQIGEDAAYLWTKVKDMRKFSLEKSGEGGSGNIVYKILRRTNYLDKLFKLSKIVYDKNNSITEGKEFIKEYLDYTYNEPLVQYFKYFVNASERDRAYDLAHEIGYLVTGYMERIVDDYPCFEELINLPFDYTDEDHIDAFVNMLDENNLCDHYIDISMDMVGDNNELPSWVYMQYNDTVKNEWCIHFGRDSYKIATNGFTNGTDDYTHLSYTRGGDGIKGFNFAFRLNNDKVNGNWYGNQAVIFRTSGVEVYHYGDDEYQVIFYGPYAHDFIPITRNGDDYDSEWQIIGRNGKVLYSSLHPSDVAKWATENLEQYRKQIMYDKVKPNYRFVESILKHKNAIMLLKEEIVADGNADSNPYKKRWDAERKALKDFICNYGKVMTSKENGKVYKVYYDKTLSQLVGYNYCICLQWDPIELKPNSILYIRALDKFTDRMFQANFDTRGNDNVMGTNDDVQNNWNNGAQR